MGHIVSIETITNGKERFAFQVESEGPYKINSLFGLFEIDSPDLIYQVCTFNDILVLLTDYKSYNNITAYDFHGNLLWNIESITGDIKIPFTCVSCVFKSDEERRFGIELPGDTEIILECIAAGFLFLVDPEKRKLLCRLSGKVK